MKQLVWWVCGVLLVVSCSPSAPEISVEDAWSFPSVGQNNAAFNIGVYATIINRGRAADRIIRVHTPRADTVEVHHSSIDEQGVMRMRAQAEVVIPSRGEVLFEPGGRHFMLVGVREGLDLGEQFPLHVTFAISGEVEVMVIVRNE